MPRVLLEHLRWIDIHIRKMVPIPRRVSSFLEKEIVCMLRGWNLKNERERRWRRRWRLNNDRPINLLKVIAIFTGYNYIT